MERPTPVTIHPSCFPERSRAAYLESFRSRRMNHRFHYESEKQAQQWLSLHEAYSPARTDDDCLQTYERAFSDIGHSIKADDATLFSLGCGGGQKDLMLLRSLSSKRINYIPTDVSLPLALTAHLRAVKELSIKSNPALIDLSVANDLSDFIASLAAPDSQRMIAFFGMLPNFEPDAALACLSSALRENDLLLISANLAPGSDYEVGVKKVLHLYDNALTRRWLATSLLDAGLDLSPSDICFSIESVRGLLRIEANYIFQTPQTIRIDGELFTYKTGDAFRLFFSFRYTPDRLAKLLQDYSIQIVRQWITKSEEEGIFLCRKD